MADGQSCWRDVDAAAIDDGFFDCLAFTRGVDGAEIRELYDRGGPERILDLTPRTGPFGARYGENPGGGHAGHAQVQSERNRLRADGA